MLISDWSSDLCYSELGLHEIDLEGPECSYTGRETIRDLPRCDKFGSGHRIGNYLDGAYHVARAHRRHRRDGGECDRLRCPIELAYAVGCINEKAVSLGDQISPPMDGRFGGEMISGTPTRTDRKSVVEGKRVY